MTEINTDYELFETKFEELTEKLTELIPEHIDKFELFEDDNDTETMIFNIKLYTIFSTNYDSMIIQSLKDSDIVLHKKILKKVCALVTDFINFVKTI